MMLIPPVAIQIQHDAYAQRKIGQFLNQPYCTDHNSIALKHRLDRQIQAVSATPHVYGKLCMFQYASFQFRKLSTHIFSTVIALYYHPLQADSTTC